MMKQKFFTIIAAAAVAFSATAQEKVIEGYFRVQNAGNPNGYVEVSGPFTAKPQLSIAQAQQSAGSVLYISAVQDGDSYRLTNLRSQGIDASMDVIAPEDYEAMFDRAINSSDPVYALVREGFQNGYTSVARATVGAVFAFVASRLGNYGDADNDTYLEVARDFNRNVVANLDLGIRLKPVDGRTVQLYYDVPNLQAVCDWYLDDSTPELAQRKANFESAMDAMSKYIETKANTSFEAFLDGDIDLLASWGYDIKAAYPDMVHSVNDNGTIITYVDCNFRTIFADKDLLFNWIKMVGYYILNPDKDAYDRFSKLGFSDMVAGVHNHYLTDLLVTYLPRLRPDKRVFLINGRVLNSSGDVSTSGNHWDAAGNTLGFASESEMAIAGINGNWILHDVDEAPFTVATPNALDATNYTALYLDFPVEAGDGEGDLKFYTLTEEKSKDVGDGVIYYYTELVPLTGTIPAQTPFILESAGATATLTIPGTNVFKPIETAPDNSFIISGDETSVQHSNARRAGETTATTGNTALRGVLLPTALTPDNMQNMWGIEYNDESPVYSFSKGTVNAKDHLYFVPGASSLAANEAIYVPGEHKTNNMMLIGEPDMKETTGVSSIETDTEAASGAFYDLNGVRVDEPLPGHIYIHNGKKVLVR